MAPLLEDPRIRQTWNNISHNAETATESAAAGIWDFTHHYINPCLGSVSQSFEQCTSSCFPDREERARRLRERGRSRGRAEYSFDFYDDWEEEEANSGSGLLGWGNDELDRLLAGSGSSGGKVNSQPGKRKGMSYGTGRGGARRKRTIDGGTDPTIIPSTSALGFLQRLPFKIGGTLRYKPSAADMKDHPGMRREEAGVGEEGEPLVDDENRSEGDLDDEIVSGHRRKRSSTTGSGDTSDSFRSRGDLFASDGEDDAVPISDEFAMVLERRGTGLSIDDRSSGKTRSSKGKRVSLSRPLSRTVSRTTQNSDHSRPRLTTRSSSTSAIQSISSPAEFILDMPSLTDLQGEEESLRREEDAEVERKREAAIRLAQKRGLSVSKDASPAVAEENLQNDDETSSRPISETEIVTDKDSSEITGDEASPEPSSEEGFVPARLPKF